MRRCATALNRVCIPFHHRGLWVRILSFGAFLCQILRHSFAVLFSTSHSLLGFSANCTQTINFYWLVVLLNFPQKINFHIVWQALSQISPRLAVASAKASQTVFKNKISVFARQVFIWIFSCFAIALIDSGRIFCCSFNVLLSYISLATQNLLKFLNFISLTCF